MARQYLINPHSFTKDKHASAATSTIQYGEIAVNCNSASPKLYIKTATGATATGSNIILPLIGGTSLVMAGLGVELFRKKRQRK